jgi:flagellar biosynthesis protein FliQ
MKSKSKKIISAIVLTLFLTTVFSSLVMMSNMSDKHMDGGCPFSVPGQSACPQNIADMVFNHISAYNSFLNVTISSSLISLIISLLLIVVYAVFSIFIYSLLFSPPKIFYFSYSNLFGSFHNRKITSWLSLFENSPSLV